MSEKSGSRIFGGMLGGTAGGGLASILISFVVAYVGLPFEKASYHLILIIFWGALLGLGFSAGLSLNYLRCEVGKISSLLRIAIGALGGAMTGALYGWLIVGTISGGAIFGAIFSFWVALWIRISETRSFQKEGLIKNLIKFTVGGLTGGLFAGATGGLLWALLAKGARAEGYVLLATATLVMLCILWGAGIAIGVYIFSENFSARIKKLATVILLVLTFGFAPQTMNISTTDQLRIHADDTNEVQDDSTSSDVFSSYDKFEIIDIIKKKGKLGLSELVALYILTNEREYAVQAKEILLKEARGNKFTNPAHSIKSQQFAASIRAVSYLEIENVKSLFDREEKEEIVDWFKNIVDRTFAVEWVDYLYALAFRRLPVGPYENQEIGVGALAVFAQIIDTKYPDIAEKCRNYIDKHAVVWGGNFRNTDDSLGYHSWWIYNAFLVSKYRPRTEWLTNQNARDAFEWILKQAPPNGSKLGYNDFSPKNIADTLALGASLFQDGRYKWLATRMLQHLSTEEISFPFYFGLASWDDNLEAIQPTVESSYLEGPGGLPHDPGPLMPDKFVFRDGWEENSLYALMNLRYSGWHKYKASNSFVTIIYGKPFVVEDLISKRHQWLPAGRALYRDKKIDRIRLNGFQVGLDGYELLIHELLKIGSRWAQDPPQYAEVEYYEKSPTVEFAKTNLQKWRSWSHERVSIFVKNQYLAVFDRAEGKKEGRVAISWHLKGSGKSDKNALHLVQGDYQMGVFYPHHENWYQANLRDSSEKDPPASSLHDPDFDLYMISDRKPEVGFITLFAPEKYASTYTVGLIDVKDSENRLVYPDALGIHVEGLDRKDTIGITFVKDTYRYGPIRSDAELFVLTEKQDAKWFLTYKNGSFFEVNSIGKPAEVTMDDRKLQKNLNWMYIDGSLKIMLPKESGEIRIKFGKDQA